MWSLSNILFSPFTCNLIQQLNLATCIFPTHDVPSWYWNDVFFFLCLVNSYVGIISSQKSSFLHLHPTLWLNLILFLCLYYHSILCLSLLWSALNCHRWFSSLFLPLDRKSLMLGVCVSNLNIARIRYNTSFMVGAPHMFITYWMSMR